ncbi:hypothetical protein MNV_410014 [Candidatus Methanoperedens nitroreducens]|uniref:Uncharacterized protein n=1 Tax=Candidatus Methanoperedens nitratireducens TaxID=1392998 RepID=A0A284VR01_9EURY|nr:hypothetical protein MNV_410014 [Candidatus Methanoperedens nitroreducens]
MNTDLYGFKEKRVKNNEWPKRGIFDEKATFNSASTCHYCPFGRMHRRRYEEHGAANRTKGCSET